MLESSQVGGLALNISVRFQDRQTPYYSVLLLGRHKVSRLHSVTQISAPNSSSLLLYFYLFNSSQLCRKMMFLIALGSEPAPQKYAIVIEQISGASKGRFLSKSLERQKKTTLKSKATSLYTTDFDKAHGDEETWLKFAKKQGLYPEDRG